MDIVLGLIGIVLTLVGFILALITPVVFFWGIVDGIKDRDFGFFIASMVFGVICILICSGIYTLNYKISNQNEVVSEDVPNIIGYDGKGTEQSGKYSHDYIYFEQGTKEDFVLYRIDPNKAKLHHTNNKDVKIVRHHTEYTSPFKYLAIISLDENEYFDVYIP